MIRWKCNFASKKFVYDEKQISMVRQVWSLILKESLWLKDHNFLVKSSRKFSCNQLSPLFQFSKNKNQLFRRTSKTLWNADFHRLSDLIKSLILIKSLWFKDHNFFVNSSKKKKHFLTISYIYPLLTFRNKIIPTIRSWISNDRHPQSPLQIRMHAAFVFPSIYPIHSQSR